MCSLDELRIARHELQLPEACHTVEVGAEFLHTSDGSSIKNEETIILLESFGNTLHLYVSFGFVSHLPLDFLNRYIEHFHVLLL